MNSIYISTLAMTGMSAEDMIALAKVQGWALEFSSGMPYRKDMEAIYLDADIVRMPHNYFPVPEIPFVLNLASTNNVIRKRSIQHCIKGLELAKKSGSPFFAAHAGFCIDPQPEQLGKQIVYNEAFNREQNKEVFIQSIVEILATAASLQIPFLVENNVIAGFNYENNLNPFLCCESEEIAWICHSINHPLFGILLDTAHLKVSCVTLNKNKETELMHLLPFVKAIHHSDNKGLVDDNLPLSDQYWFLPFMQYTTGVTHVLEVKNLSVAAVHGQIKYLDSIWS